MLFITESKPSILIFCNKIVGWGGWSVPNIGKYFFYFNGGTLVYGNSPYLEKCGIVSEKKVCATPCVYYYIL